MSGGVKVLLQHVRLLRELGHDALLLTKRIVYDWADMADNAVILREDLSDMPDCDLYVATVASEVRTLYRSKGAGVAHLCQGYEPEEYGARIRGESVTERYRATGPFSFLKRAGNNLRFRRRIRRFEAAYALPTVKMAVSRHLADLIEGRYGQRCFLVQNGVDQRVFYLGAEYARGGALPGPVRVLSTGSIHVGSKDIPDTLEAIRILKDRGCPVELTRVSPGPPSEEETKSAIVDRFLIAISEREMAALYRETDIFVSSSLEGEGFGLPAIEALLSGVPCVLTEISTYNNFSATRDFAYFVPMHRPEAIADGIMTLINEGSIRNTYIERGLEVAKAFSLERTKEHLAAFVEEISAESSKERRPDPAKSLPARGRLFLPAPSGPDTRGPCRLHHEGLEAAHLFVQMARSQVLLYAVEGRIVTYPDLAGGDARKARFLESRLQCGKIIEEPVAPVVEQVVHHHRGAPDGHVRGETRGYPLYVRGALFAPLGNQSCNFSQVRGGKSDPPSGL